MQMANLVYVDRTKTGKSLWSKFHELDIRILAIQDTRLHDSDKQRAAQQQASMLADGCKMEFSWSNAPSLGMAEGVGVLVKGTLVSRVKKCKKNSYDTGS